MIGFMKKIGEFQQKFGFPRKLSFPQLKRDSQVDECLKVTHKQLGYLLQDIHIYYEETNDIRLYRLGLIMEELQELSHDLRSAEESDVADSLGDLVYVVAGTADTFNIPLAEVVDEIHRSNMTKQTGTINQLANREKGPNYVPPKIDFAIKLGRHREAASDRMLQYGDINTNA